MGFVLRTLNKLNNWFALIEKIMLAVILSVMIIISFSQVISRNFFDTAWPLGDIITRHLLLWVCFIGASLTTYNRSHIKIDILRVLPMPVKTGKWVFALADLFAVVVCVLMSIAGYNFLIDEFNSGSKLAEGVPRWAFMVVIPVWLWVMSARFAGNCAKSISGDTAGMEDSIQ